MKRSIEPGTPLYSDFQKFSQQLRERVVSLRHQKGFTQEDMQTLGLSLRQYQRIESGETENITLANLYRIAHAFDISVSELLAL